jgi:Amt family ammonium transporter
VCGTWGVLAVGLFADGSYGNGWNGISGGVTGLFYGDPGQFVAQIFHAGFNFLWAWGVMWLIIKGASKFIQIRVSPEAEIEGLDMPEFGVLAYPDYVMSHSSAGNVSDGAIDVVATGGAGVTGETS